MTRLWTNATPTCCNFRASHGPTACPSTRVTRMHLQAIWSIPIQGGQPVKIAGPTQRFPVGFTVTSEGIYYGAPPHAGEQRFIWFLSFSTGRNNPVVIAKRPFHSGISVSPDSSYIIFDQYDESGSDLMLIENFRPR